MKSLCRSWLLGALALLMAVPAALAEDRAPFRQAELDQMLAPVALYPDPLLSQVLMASTYPLEIVQAARWSRANPGLQGQAAVNAVEPMDWEPSVKSLTAFPHVLAMMNERLEWTERLGEAFLAQQEDVMNTVQSLRRRAEAAGYLRSSEQMRVERESGVIVISPPASGVVYVPYYDPALIYGPWWWPAYPPVAWAPPPTYYAIPPYPSAWLWGSGIVLSTGFFFGHFDWPHRRIRVRHFHHSHHHAHPHRVWQHNPVHRRGVPFRSAQARHRFEQHRAAFDSRRDESARAQSHASGARAPEARPRHRPEFHRDPAPGPRHPDGRNAAGSSASPAVSPAPPGSPPARAGSVERRSQPPAAPAGRESRTVQRVAPAQAPRHARAERSDRPSFRSSDPGATRQPSRGTERRVSAPPAASGAVRTPTARAEVRPQIIQGGSGHSPRGVPQRQISRERAAPPRAVERAAPQAAPAIARGRSVDHHRPRTNGAHGNRHAPGRTTERGPGRRS